MQRLLRALICQPTPLHICAAAMLLLSVTGRHLKPDAMWCGLAAKCTYPGTAYVDEQFGDAGFPRIRPPAPGI